MSANPKSRRVFGSPTVARTTQEPLDASPSPARSFTPVTRSDSPASTKSPEKHATEPAVSTGVEALRLRNQVFSDDEGHDRSPVRSPNKDLTPSKRKTLNLDLFEGSMSFSLSDVNSYASSRSKSPTPINRPRLTRTHWKHPSSNSSCHFQNCNKSLNVKNGIVNCRRCGDLFCNAHTDFKARLRNPTKDETIPQYDNQGIWSKCCENCYFNKPSLRDGLQVNHQDLTSEFVSKRRIKQEKNQLVSNKLLKRFIRHVNVLTELYFSKLKHNRGKSILEQYISPWKVDEALLLDLQKQIVGYENWQDDAIVKNCYICFTQFNLFVRKHHCRMCGQIVCDDSFQERQDCSLLVPIAVFISKLKHLNYSLQVKENMPQLLKAKDELLSLRVCRICKDHLLYDYKFKQQSEKALIKSQDSEHHRLSELFGLYDQLLISKAKIIQYIPKYNSIVTDEEFKPEKINKIRDTLMGYVKEFEHLLSNFKRKYSLNDVSSPFIETHKKLLIGINQSLALFLQDKITMVKNLNTIYQEKENALLNKKKTVEPKFTKKQIRELREQLMVMNEQNFIIENLINDVTKQRKFDEIQPLMANKEEISKEIARLEETLGEFGF